VFIKKSNVLIILLAFISCFFTACTQKKVDVSNQSENTNTKRNIAKEKCKVVPIVLTFDNGYFYPSIITSISMLKSANEDTFYEIYALVPGDFKKENKIKLFKLQERYKNCNFNFIDMEEKFKNWKEWMGSESRFSNAAWFRMKIPSTLPENVHKCFYTDVDVIIKKDLSELMDLDLGNNYIAGVADAIFRDTKDIPEWGKRYAIGMEKFDQYVYSGNLMFNLDACRNENIEEKFENYYKKFKNGLDQAAINSVCYNKIGKLHLKYCVCTIFENWYEPYNQNTFLKKCYSEEEVNEAFNFPVVIHYAGEKPWNNPEVKFSEEWWKCAKESEYWREIREEYFSKLNIKGKKLVESF